MILEFIENEFVDLRVSLMDDGSPAELKDGEKLQFVSKIRTENGAHLLNVISTLNDVDGKTWFYFDLAELKAKPGKYRFEINLLTADGKSQNVIKNSDGVLIISPKEKM
ncbi:MAG: hypothetical protein J6A60_02130 [Clostridia bacterium]|nr:hypothetical protein [Clostridia bacterium]